MLSIILSLVSRYLVVVRVGLLAVAVASLVGLWYVVKHTDGVRVEHPSPEVTRVYVDRPVIHTKDLLEYIDKNDHEAVRRLMKENEKLRNEVTIVLVQKHKGTSTGEGPVTVSGLPQYTIGPLPPSAPVFGTEAPTIPEPFKLTFKDWRLAFESDGTQAHYTLTQQFSIISTAGRDKNNEPTNSVELYEIGSNGERVLIPVTEVTRATAKPTSPFFYAKPSLQGGMAVLPQSVSGDVEYDAAFALSLPWFKRGTTTAAEDTRWAYLTPMVTVSDQEWTGGVVPVSFNLGTIKHTPFNDLWVSPYAGISSDRGRTKFAITLSTTF